MARLVYGCSAASLNLVSVLAMSQDGKGVDVRTDISTRSQMLRGGGGRSSGLPLFLAAGTTLLGGVLQGPLR